MEITVSVALPSRGVEFLAAATQQTAKGLYRVIPGIELSGEWEVVIDALITDFDQEKFVIIPEVG